jgi:hypothetical protein
MIRMQSACVTATELIGRDKLRRTGQIDAMAQNASRATMRGGVSGRATGRTTIIDSRTSGRKVEPEIGMIARDVITGRTGRQRTCERTVQVAAWIEGAKI